MFLAVDHHVRLKKPVVKAKGGGIYRLIERVGILFPAVVAVAIIEVHELRH
jgi:hypothetical protein